MTQFTDPFRLRVLKGLSASLKQITPANGYQFDFSDYSRTFADNGETATQERVFRGRTWFGTADPIPMLSILEGVDPASEVSEPPQMVAAGEFDWDLLVQGWVDDDKAHPTDPGAVALADVQKRLAFEVKRTLPGDPTERDIFGLRASWEAANPGQTYSSRNQIVNLRFGMGVVRPADEVNDKAWFWLSVTPRLFVNPAYPYG